MTRKAVAISGDFRCYNSAGDVIEITLHPIESEKCEKVLLINVAHLTDLIDLLNRIRRQRIMG